MIEGKSDVREEAGGLTDVFTDDIRDRHVVPEFFRILHIVDSIPFPSNNTLDLTAETKVKTADSDSHDKFHSDNDAAAD